MVSELWWRESVNTFLLVFFSRGYSLQIWLFHIEDWYIFIDDFVISALYDLNNNITVLTLESIVILGWNMHSKFWLSLLIGDDIL